MQTSCVLSVSVLNRPVYLNRTLVWSWQKHTPLKGEARKEMFPSLWMCVGRGSQRFIGSPHPVFFTRLCCLVLRGKCSLSAPQLQCHARQSLPHSRSCQARSKCGPSMGPLMWWAQPPQLVLTFSLSQRIISLELSEDRSKASTCHLMSQFSSV